MLLAIETYCLICVCSGVIANALAPELFMELSRPCCGLASMSRRRDKRRLRLLPAFGLALADAKLLKGFCGGPNVGRSTFRSEPIARRLLPLGWPRIAVAGLQQQKRKNTPLINTLRYQFLWGTGSKPASLSLIHDISMAWITSIHRHPTDSSQATAAT
jgi:hypothetical protein